MWAPPPGQIESVRTTRRSIPASRSRGGEPWGRVQARRRGTSLMSTTSNWKPRYLISWQIKVFNQLTDQGQLCGHQILYIVNVVHCPDEFVYKICRRFKISWLVIYWSINEKNPDLKYHKHCLWKDLQTNFTYFRREFCTCIKICTEN